MSTTSTGTSTSASTHNPDHLLVACQKGNLQEVQRLIEEERVDPNHSNLIRQSALHIAAWWARQDCLQYLLQQGANVHATNTMTGATPLHCSLQSSKAALKKTDRLASLRVLLEHGADPKALDLSQRIPLDYLDEDDMDRLEIIELFQEFVQPMPKIFVAMSQQDMDMFRQSLTTDEQVLLLQYQDQTPLLQLVSDWCGNDDADPRNDPFYREAIYMVLTLAQQKGDDDSLVRTNANHETAMDILCRSIVQRYKQFKTVDTFGKDWCDVVNCLVGQCSQNTHKLYYTSDKTPSLWIEIARHNLLELAYQFQLWNIPSYTVNRQGMTPLQFAARSGHLEMLPLVANESSWRHQDARGQTALQAAKVNGQDLVVKWLEEYESTLPQK